MQIFAYPGDRVDFVSKSGSAGSLCFGDSRTLAEEFFGPAHEVAGEELSYYSGSLLLRFKADSLKAVILRPSLSKHEKVEVYLNRTRLNGLDPDSLAQAIAAAGEGVTVRGAEGLEEIEFSAL
ncbi:hypothetical protein [Corynebacterium flavescens]|uniref:hypothetical protein n=1 Tax=Corynebacterium flavescens TaxID=28028 RepID=UPI00289B04C3|nr:hypothetical protein [Corynebacterium flavescens]